MTTMLDAPAVRDQDDAAPSPSPPPPTRAELRAAALRQAVRDVELLGAVPTTEDDDTFMAVLRPNFAACRDQDPKLFTPGDAWAETDDVQPVEPAPYPSAVAQSICNGDATGRPPCPIRTSCLAYALRHDEVGIWGGTTEYQRRQLSRPQARAACPYCGSDMLTYDHRSEVCIDCGTSWPLPKAKIGRTRAGSPV